MLSQPEGVHGGQPWLLIHSVISGMEAVEVGSADPTFLSSSFGTERGQQRLANMQVRVLQLSFDLTNLNSKVFMANDTFRHEPKIMLVFCCAAIDIRSI